MCMWWLSKGYRVSVLRDEKVLESCLHGNEHILNTTELSAFKNGDDCKFCVFFFFNNNYKFLKIRQHDR